MTQELIEIARQEAAKNYHGTGYSVGNLYLLSEGFPDEIPSEGLDDDWSGAFAYRCVRLAGFDLPIHYPDPRIHAGFERTDSWEEYAKLPKINLWRADTENAAPGDLVFLNMPEKSPSIVGILLSRNGDELEIAAGNYRGHSAIFQKTVDSLVGFIRLSAD